MTFKYNNVYINETATITGPYEAKGPLGTYFDKSYDEFYFETKGTTDKSAIKFWTKW